MTIAGRISCLFGKHAPTVTNGQWTNSPSGDGFNVTDCQHCGRELTKRHGGTWRAISAGDRS